MAEIVLTPEMLIAQATQMQTLAGEFESLFSQTTNVLHGMNDSWSENIATNFVSKILLAQQSFSSITNMLSNGSAAARMGALSFQNGINMGDMLDHVNAIIDPVTGKMSYDDGDDSNGIEMSTAIEGAGNIKDNYIHGLGKYIAQDYKDIDRMIHSENPVSHSEAAGKYAEMVWHYTIGGLNEAASKAVGLDSNKVTEGAARIGGWLYEQITGDKGSAEYIREFHSNGSSGQNIRESVEDIASYYGDKAKKLYHSVFK